LSSFLINLPNLSLSGSSSFFSSTFLASCFFSPSLPNLVCVNNQIKQTIQKRKEKKEKYVLVDYIYTLNKIMLEKTNKQTKNQNQEKPIKSKKTNISKTINTYK
jgi:hypothetical protein